MPTKLERLTAIAQEDLKIDQDNLDNEIARIPHLFSKYLNMLSVERLRLKQLENDLKVVRKQRWEIYTGKEQGTGDDFFPHKIIRGDVSIYIDADDKIQRAELAVSLQKEIVFNIEKIVDHINRRGLNIKSMIDWKKFTNGSY